MSPDATPTFSQRSIYAFPIVLWVCFSAGLNFTIRVLNG